jgi:hypothetical protein
MIKSRDETAEGLQYAINHPAEAVKAVWESIEESLSMMVI